MHSRRVVLTCQMYGIATERAPTVDRRLVRRELQ